MPQNRRKELIYWGIFSVVVILYHLSIKAYFGDDFTSFSKILSQMSLKDWIYQRYNGWSSRIIIEVLLVIFARNIFLWKIANILISVLLAYSLYRLSHKVSLSAVLALTLSYPIIDMASAGWIATFMNYYWPLSFGLYSLTALDKSVRGERVKWWEIVFSYSAAIIGVNVEQYCAIHFAMLLLYTAGLVAKKRRRGATLFMGHYLITCFSLLFIFTTPGNTVRKSAEVVTWMKDFYEKTVLDKLLDGLGNTMSILLSSSNILFAVFTIVLFACIWKKTQNSKYRIIGGLPLIVVLLVSFGKININGFFDHFVNLITSNIGVSASNWIKVSAYLSIWVYGLIILCIVLSFVILFDEIRKIIECSFVFCIAIASYVVMGFSPTLFASGRRPMIFCYFLLIFLTLRLLEYAGNLFSDREIAWGRNIIWGLCIIAALNNVASAGNMI